jgi:hypothetical protein
MHSSEKRPGLGCQLGEGVSRQPKLMTQDRVDSGSLPITHDFLATMLGTDRPTVSLAAGVLQRKKLIEYTRGAVKIVNRKQLEDSACECYGVIRQYDGELGLK